jgi:RNA polymerase sigma factor (sigma-70 family)
LPSSSLHDLADLRALQEGDERALDRLIARWERPLLAFAWRYLHQNAEARDMVAEAFVRLYQQRHRLRPDTNLSAWLFTTVANLCRNQHRWRQRHPAWSLDAPIPPGPERASAGNTPADPQLPPDQALAHQEELEALHRAIERLPHDLKTALFLHHFEHLSYRQIGDITGCQERGVETRLYRARHALRQALAGFHQETACS